jgi:hypothetical protein
MKIGKWSIIVPDKIIAKQYSEGEGVSLWFYIRDESFWRDNLALNIKAIQYTGDNSDTQQVEYNDGSLHSHFTGDIKKFADEWDKAYLLKLQNDWDRANLTILLNSNDPGFNSQSPDIKQYRDETEEEKIARIGNRPTSYASTDIY